MRRAAALLFAALAGLLCSGSAARAVPVPQDDPFYAVPGGLDHLANGTILRSRSVAASSIGVPLPATAWQLQYKSLDAHNRPTAMVTTIMVPSVPWTGPGARPVVSFQVAEDGAGTQCAASYALDGGLAAGSAESNAFGETGLMATLLARGWAVIAPDYEGPDSHFFAAPEEAHGVLDSVRAALRFTPAGFAAATQVGLMGYSGGGYATSVAASMQPAYAPELHLAGAAIGSPTGSVRAEVTAFDGTVAGGAIAMAIAALSRAYPEQHLEQYLNAAGRAAVAATGHDCLASAAQAEPFGRMEDWEASPGVLDRPPLSTFLQSISPEFMPAHPTIPVLLYHDRTDEFAPIGPALDQFSRWCAAGTPVQEHIDPVGEHIAYEELAAPVAMDWLAARFAGQPVSTSCHAPAPPAPVAGHAGPRRVTIAGSLGRGGRLTLRLGNPNAGSALVTGVAVSRGRYRLARRLRLRIHARASRLIHLRVRRSLPLRVAVNARTAGHALRSQTVLRAPARRRSVARRWYVRADAAAGGTGSRAAPFDSLAGAQRASRAGDTIVIEPAPTALDGGIALQPRQTLEGDGPAVTGLPANAARPRLVNDTGRLAGDAVRLADGDTVRNLAIGPAGRGGIYGSGISTANVTDNDLSATNTSCTTGFVVQPFKLPSLVPGVAVPFSGGLPNGWAGIMVDEGSGSARLQIDGNAVHDSGCADGIDVRASGTASVAVEASGNRLSRLQEGSQLQSVLAIGMQTIGHATLDATLSGNAESYIGTATVGDEGVADSEGLFANAAGASQLTERVTGNTFAHGLGHLSANCVEVVSSSGAPVMDFSLTHSTCDYVVGDILEAVNLTAGATMHFAADDVRAAHSDFTAGPEFHQVEPGDDGDCLFELGAGAGSTTTVSVTNSTLTDCDTDGLEAAATVDDGSGPVRELAFDVRHSRITGNGLSNVRVANSSPVTQLDGRVEDTDLAGTSGVPIILENLATSGGTHARLDFGGGPLGSTGGNCLAHNGLTVEDARQSLSARGDWWGSAAGPGLGGVVALGGSADSSDPLARAPAAC